VHIAPAGQLRCQIKKGCASDELLSVVEQYLEAYERLSELNERLV
jgi:hypothetical protein